MRVNIRTVSPHLSVTIVKSVNIQVLVQGKVLKRHAKNANVENTLSLKDKHHVKRVGGLVELDAPGSSRERAVVVKVRVHAAAKMYRPLGVSVRGRCVCKVHLHP